MSKLRINRVIWAAGFFDGEGCVQIHRVNQKRPKSESRTVHFRLLISASNTEEEILYEFQNLWGGCVVENNREGTWKACYQWQATGRVAAAALEEMLPWLKTSKRDKAELGLEFQSHRKKGWITQEERERRLARDEDFYETMKFANQRGTITVI